MMNNIPPSDFVNSGAVQQRAQVKAGMGQAPVKSYSQGNAPAIPEDSGTSVAMPKMEPQGTPVDMPLPKADLSQVQLGIVNRSPIQKGIVRQASVIGPRSVGFGERPIEGKFQGKTDKIARFEIPDDKATLNSSKRWKESADGSFRMDTVLEHEGLYQAYPQLKETPVRKKDLGQVEGKDIYASFDGKNINISSKIVNMLDSVEGDPFITAEQKAAITKGITSLVIHELQHSVQNIEGFAYGKDGITQKTLAQVSGMLRDRGLSAEQVDAELDKLSGPYGQRPGEMESAYVQNKNDGLIKEDALKANPDLYEAYKPPVAIPDAPAPITAPPGYNQFDPSTWPKPEPAPVPKPEPKPVPKPAPKPAPKPTPKPAPKKPAPKKPAPKKPPAKKK